MTHQGLRSAGWLLGLPGLGLIWVGATLYAAPDIAARIAVAGETVAQATEAGSPEPWLRVSVRGRDLVAEGEAPGPAARAAALARLEALPEPRRIVPEIGLIETAAPFAWSATRTAPDRIAFSGSRPAEIGRAALRTRLAAEIPDETAIDDAAHAARGAPPDFPAAAAYAVARLRNLAAGGTATVTDLSIAFSGAALDLAAYDALRTALTDPPPGYTIGRIDIVPARADDFTMSVSRNPGGGLVLDGFVVSESARAEIGRLAGEISDGTAVTDRMRTARGLAKDVDPDALAKFLIRLVGLMQGGGARFDGARVSVAGDAVDSQAVGEIEAVMRDARPAGVGAGSVALAVKPLSPYRVAIRREADGVSLSGHLPDAEARDRLLAVVRPRFFRERIIDRTRIADGAPPDLAAALTAAVPVLASLSSGEVAVADRTLILSGTSLYREAAARVAATLPAAMPAGWTASVAVVPKNPAPTRDPETCRSAATALVGGTGLRFAPGSGALSPIFYPVLDRLAELAKTCPSLRIAVAGHGDPAKTAPPDAKVADAAQTQGIASAAPKPEAGKAALAKPEPTKSGETKPAAKAVPAKDAKGSKDTKTSNDAKSSKDAKAAKDTKPAKDTKAGKETAEAPEPDLPRLRAGAVVEYLLQAGAGLDQVVVADKLSERPGIAFAVLP
ncbi:BON domain-containing protein [Methylobacterium sp. WL12]|uniref:BON domain-containing protein n=1 Tax=Methylobacterium sp. WL12 TaxID=2603890 RepID=UPI0011CC87D0|nr:BON domain-containing protein [Methylobacterium sp. WL12]TXM73441.1 BON domain-containing protein [Methylobacterium sp. WL12]